MRKELGKITTAKFGTISDYPFLCGLILQFSLNGGSTEIGCGGKYTVNMSEECEWEESEKTRNEIIVENIDHIYKLLNKAKVNVVSELAGIPVEVEIEGNGFKGFRILEEVL